MRYLLLLLSWIMFSAFYFSCSSTRKISGDYPHLKYLVKDSSLYQYFTIDTSGISFFAEPAEKILGNPECKIYAAEKNEVADWIAQIHPDSVVVFYKNKGLKHFSEMSPWEKGADSRNLTPKQKSKDKNKPLKGIRIAIDPGHIETTMEMAQIEEKYIKMHPSPATQNQEIAFNEANLTLSTALILSQKLQEKGAVVMLSRPRAGYDARGINFSMWKDMVILQDIENEIKAGRMDSAYAHNVRLNGTPSEIYRKLYVPIDLRKRAEKINLFHPDLTVIIHYNVHGPNWELRDSNNYCSPSPTNYNMAFVGGSFMKGELTHLEDRVAFMRLLLTPSLPKSIDLSAHVIEQFEKHLGVAPVTPKDSLLYLDRSSILTEKTGVYARNLSLTRMVGGVLCYGESLCQDNLQECISLNKKDLHLTEVTGNERTKQVAESYFEAIMAYFK
jgi:N-acetylmuramoyl-L-alanine amidase